MSISIRQRTLKIGLVQDGKLISENILRDKPEVTIGTDPSNLVTVAEANMPRRHKLLVRHKKGFELNYLPEMTGKVSLKEGSFDLSSLSDSGLARTKDRFSIVDLGQVGKGKISIGRTTLLFQVVPAPPLPPLEKLPKEFRRGYFRRVDLTFVLILVLSALFHIAAIFYLNSIPVEEGLSEERAMKFVSKVTTEDIIIPPEEEEGVPEDADLEGKDKKKKPVGTGNGKAKGDGEGDGAGDEKGDVMSKGLLAVITSASNGGSVADIIGDSGTDSGIDQIIGKVGGGVQIARSGMGLAGGSKGTGGSGLSGVSAGQLGTVSGPKTVQTGQKTEKSVKGKVGSGGSNVSGNVDTGSVRSYILRRIGGVRACYERQLKIDPSLCGKVAVSFTIGEDGRVASCSVTNSTIGNASVPGCVCRTIGRWRFPVQPEGGAASVSYSFIFTPAN